MSHNSQVARRHQRGILSAGLLAIARAMFPALAVRLVFCAGCFGAWMLLFPELSSGYGWMAGSRRRRFWSFWTANRGWNMS